MGKDQGRGGYGQGEAMVQGGGQGPKGGLRPRGGQGSLWSKEPMVEGAYGPRSLWSMGGYGQGSLWSKETKVNGRRLWSSIKDQGRLWSKEAKEAMVKYQGRLWSKGEAMVKGGQGD